MPKSTVIARRENSPICLIHIGKTGGTFLKEIIQRNTQNTTRPIMLLDHASTLTTTENLFGSDRKIAFVYRHPTARFVSGFMSRLRMGRPTYNSPWSVEEAVSFQYFSQPNDLAEALYSDDHRMRSAAIFAMESIVHIKRNYSFYFESIARLNAQKANIVACIDLKDLTPNLGQFLGKLGIADVEFSEELPRHASPQTANPLSPLARKNLARYMRTEFSFYSYFKKLDVSL